MYTTQPKYNDTNSSNKNINTTLTSTTCTSDIPVINLNDEWDAWKAKKTADEESNLIYARRAISRKANLRARNSAQPSPTLRCSAIFSKYVNKDDYGHLTCKLRPFKVRINYVGETKYFPGVSREWKNSIYVFNKNNMKNLPVYDININSLIKDYFNLDFKNKFLFKKFRGRKHRRLSMNKIFVSKAEIKHTNTKAILTVYTYNREKVSLLKKIKRLKLDFYINLRNLLNISKKYKLLTYIESLASHVGGGSGSDVVVLDQTTKAGVLAILYRELILLRKYKLILSLNKSKFEEKLLYKLNNLIMKYYNKKVEFNIVNLKALVFHSDFFTRILSLKFKNRNAKLLKLMKIILNKAALPRVNLIKERSRVIKSVNFNLLQNKFDIFNVGYILVAAVTAEKKDNDLSDLLNRLYYNVLLNSSDKNQIIFNKNSKAQALEFEAYNKIYEIIFKSINYKNMSGVRLEAKGRLTRRYRADRSQFKVKWKGGLKNIDASFKGLSTVNLRGYANANVEYSIFTSKRRIGAFAVKGWISGK